MQDINAYCYRLLSQYINNVCDNNLFNISSTISKNILYIVYKEFNICVNSCDFKRLVLLQHNIKTVISDINELFGSDIILTDKESIANSIQKIINLRMLNTSYLTGFIPYTKVNKINDIYYEYKDQYISEIYYLVYLLLTNTVIPLLYDLDNSYDIYYKYYDTSSNSIDLDEEDFDDEEESDDYINSLLNKLNDEEDDQIIDYISDKKIYFNNFIFNNVSKETIVGILLKIINRVSSIDFTNEEYLEKLFNTFFELTDVKNNVYEYSYEEYVKIVNNYEEEESFLKDIVYVEQLLDNDKYFVE